MAFHSLNYGDMRFTPRNDMRKPKIWCSLCNSTLAYTIEDIHKLTITDPDTIYILGIKISDSYTTEYYSGLRGTNFIEEEEDGNPEESPSVTIIARPVYLCQTPCHDLFLEEKACISKSARFWMHAYRSICINMPRDIALIIGKYIMEGPLITDYNIYVDSLREKIETAWETIHGTEEEIDESMRQLVEWFAKDKRVE